MSDWTKQLGTELKKKDGCIMPIGKGWRTMQTLIKESAYGVVKTRQIVRGLMEEGKVRVFMGTQKNACGIIVRQVWYKLDE